MGDAVRLPVFRFVSERALLVEYGEVLDDGIHNQVLALDAAIRGSCLGTQVETLPTFRSLLIQFDPFEVEHDSLLQSIASLDTEQIAQCPKRWRVPVCFDGNHGEDMSEVSDLLGLDSETIISILLAQPLKLYMYGFAPGFAYLGGLDSRLALPRRATPRAPMAPGSLMIAGGLASLVSFSMPTGWYVIGQTPLHMFSARRDPMVPFAVGDQLELYPVDRYRYLELTRKSDLAGLELL